MPGLSPTAWANHSFPSPTTPFRWRSPRVACSMPLSTAADTSGLPAPVTRTLALGNASAALLEAAEDADLVVVGSRGLGGFKGLVLGSVSHHVAHHATCPVIVLPSAAD